MAHWRVRGPKSLIQPLGREARYELLAGDENQRLTYYIARRRLQFTIEEWDALLWWHQQVYLEGINIEFPPPKGDEDVEVGDDLSRLSSMGLGPQVRAVT